VEPFALSVGADR